MTETQISKPLQRILFDLTGEDRFDIALQLATKDLLRLKLKEAEERLAVFQNRYALDFEKFKQAWNDKTIPNRHSYEVEKDFWEWEAAETDKKKIWQMLEQLP
jgi:hypothetical protein